MLLLLFASWSTPRVGAGYCGVDLFFFLVGVLTRKGAGMAAISLQEEGLLCADGAGVGIREVCMRSREMRREIGLH